MSTGSGRVSFPIYIHRFRRLPQIILVFDWSSHPPLPRRERIEVRVSCFESAQSVDDQWNLKRTRCSSALIPRPELSPSNWAKPERFVFTAGKLTDRRSPTSRRFI